MAALTLLPLPDLRLPGQPHKPITLDGKPLHICIDASPSDRVESAAEPEGFSPAIGVATILYHWCPDALFALLDVEHWFSFTWLLTIDAGSEEEMQVELGRIRNRVTMGTLDRDGRWTLMVTYDIAPREGEASAGPWEPNIEETMVEGRNVEDAVEVERLGAEFVRDVIVRRRWLTGKKMRHEFFVESPEVGTDPWADGMRMNPRWLYESLNLDKCTMCYTSSAGEGKVLSRCGRCGTAAYCSSDCQQKDWPVHKGVCSMSAEDRGKALHYTQYGGLIGWKHATPAA